MNEIMIDRASITAKSGKTIPEKRRDCHKNVSKYWLFYSALIDSPILMRHSFFLVTFRKKGRDCHKSEPKISVDLFNLDRFSLYGLQLQAEK